MRRKYKISDDDYHRIYLASSEAFINAIVHGNKRDPNKKVRVKFKVFKRSFEIEIQDEGEGFTPEGVPDPTVDENLLKESGRGVFIMQAFADVVKFHKTKSGMKVIIKIKKRSSAL
ncbi:serine/threonine-protein kinase RsbW [Candidatus Kryptonium thompsonii]|nr:serine/threonine-protein kinase RsbW [Candidatus Kryptonium thompsoni]